MDSRLRRIQRDTAAVARNAAPEGCEDGIHRALAPRFDQGRRHKVYCREFGHGMSAGKGIQRGGAHESLGIIVRRIDHDMSFHSGCTDARAIPGFRSGFSSGRRADTGKPLLVAEPAGLAWTQRQT
jgi:hypothetical protein